jgi:hypothetical protein
MPGNGGINLTVDNKFIINLKKRYIWIKCHLLKHLLTVLNCFNFSYKRVYFLYIELETQSDD